MVILVALQMYGQMLRIRLFEERVNEPYTSARMPGLAYLYILCGRDQPASRQPRPQINGIREAGLD